MSSRNRYRAFQLIHRRITHLADTYDLTLAVEDLEHVGRHVTIDDKRSEPAFLVAAQRTQDARPGLPGAASYDGPGSSSIGGTGSTSSPTERAAIPRCCNDPDECDCVQSRPSDRTSSDRATLDRLLYDLTDWTRPQLVTDPPQYAATITRLCLSLRNLVDAWTPRTPNARDLRIVQVANAAPIDCEHHTTAGIFEAAQHTGTVSGNLDLPMRLCGFCYWQVRRHGKLPSAEAMERRRRTGKNAKERVS